MKNYFVMDGCATYGIDVSAWGATRKEAILNAAVDAWRNRDA